jgi:hypothetical protein
MPGKASSGDSVNRRFRFIVSVIYAVVLTLVLWLFFEQWRGYRDASEAQREFAVLKAAMHAMANISAERRPTFAQLNRGPLVSEQQLTALKDARRATDKDIEELGTRLRNPRCKNCASLIPTYIKAVSTLTEARQDLDAIDLQESLDRMDTDILHAFDHLVTTIPQLSSIAATGRTACGTTARASWATCLSVRACTGNAPGANRRRSI